MHKGAGAGQHLAVVHAALGVAVAVAVAVVVAGTTFSAFDCQACCARIETLELHAGGKNKPSEYQIYYSQLGITLLEAS